MQVVVAVLLLGAIPVDLVASRCDLPRASGSRAAGVAAASGSTEADPCRSTCVPDCYCCSQSEGAVLGGVEHGPRVVVVAFGAPATRAIDGFRTLPYHPPLGLL